MYGTVDPPSGRIQIDAGSIREGVSHLDGTTLIRILIDAGALLIRGAQIAADPAPELAASSRGPVAEMDDVLLLIRHLDFHAADGTAQAIRSGGGHECEKRNCSEIRSQVSFAAV